MKKETTHLLHLIETFLVVVVVIVFLLSRDVTLSYFAKKLTDNTPISYKKLSGNILTSINIEELKYKNKVVAKLAKVDFNLFALLVGKVEVDDIKISKIDIKAIREIVKGFDKNSSSSSEFNVAVSLKNAHFDFLAYSIGKYKIKKASLNLKNISTTDGKVFNAKKISLDMLTNMWSLKADGSMKKNIFFTDAKVWLNDKYFKKFIKDMDFNSLNPVKVKLKLDKEHLEGDVLASSKHLFSKKLKNLEVKIKSLTSHTNFVFKDLNLHLNTKIKASSKYTKDVDIDGDLFYKKGTPFYYTAKAKIPEFTGFDKNITSNFKDTTALFKGDKKTLYIDIKNENLKASCNFVNDYFKPKIKLSSKFLNLDGVYDIKKSLLLATVQKPQKLYMPKKIKYENLFPLKTELNLKKEPKLTITTKNNLLIKGEFDTKSHEFNSSFKSNFINFTANGSVKRFDYKLHVENLKLAQKEINQIIDFKKTGLDSTFDLVGYYKDNKFDSQIKANWLVYEYDRYKYLYFEGLLMDLRYENGVLTIPDYRAKGYLLDRYRDIFSSQPSKVYIGKNSLKLDFNINDKILIRGDMLGSRGIKIYANNYFFNQPEAKVHLNLNLNYKSKAGISYIDGNVKILNGEIYYKVKNTRVVEDKDIIFVNRQKERKKEVSKSVINVKVTSNTIRYKQGKNDIRFSLDLNLQKKIAKELEVFGKVTILDGFYYSENKKFELGQGKVLFDGDLLSPYLNLKAYYKRDPYDITIHVGGKLDSPILTFSSTPYLRQNDILSILLFNTKASSLTNSDSNTNPALSIFGSSLAKGLTDSLGVKLDRVDLKTTKDGGIGIELEKRVSKRTTIIYENDIIQTIKIRYKNSQNIETDFTFSPESSGIDIIYTNEK